MPRNREKEVAKLEKSRIYLAGREKEPQSQKRRRKCMRCKHEEANDRLSEALKNRLKL